MKTRYTLFQIALEVIGMILLVLYIAFIAGSWGNLPDMVPAHFNAAGIVDRWGNKSEIIFLPAIAALMYAGMSIILFFPQTWNVPKARSLENSYFVYSTIKTMMIFLKAEIVATFFFISYFSIMGSNLPVWFLPVYLIILFVPIIYFTFKSYRLARM